MEHQIFGLVMNGVGKIEDFAFKKVMFWESGCILLPNCSGFRLAKNVFERYLLLRQDTSV